MALAAGVVAPRQLFACRSLLARAALAVLVCTIESECGSAGRQTTRVLLAAHPLPTRDEPRGNIPDSSYAVTRISCQNGSDRAEEAATDAASGEGVDKVSFRITGALSGDNQDSGVEQILALIGKGRGEVAHEKPQDAVASYHEAERLLKGLYQRLLHGRGVAKSLLQMHEEAVADLEEVAKVNPGSAEVWVEVGVERQALQQHERAFEAFNTAVELEPSNAEAVRLRGMAAYESHRFKQAIADLLPALHMQPNDADLNRIVGFAYVRSNQFRASQPYLARAVALRPEDAEVRKEKGRVHRLVGETQESEKEFLKSLEFKQILETHHNLVLLGRLTGDHWATIRAAERGLAAFPGDSELMHALASSCHVLGDHAKAMHLYDQLLSQEAEGGPYKTSAFFQRHLLAYTVSKLHLPFTSFQIDDEFDEDFRGKWSTGGKPGDLQSYTPLSLPDHQLQAATWQRLPRLSGDALELVAAADVIGRRTHCDTDGMLLNTQQVRMAGLAALDLMQQVRATLLLIAHQMRITEEIFKGDANNGWREELEQLLQRRRGAHRTGRSRRTSDSSDGSSSSSSGGDGVGADGSGESSGDGAGSSSSNDGSSSGGGSDGSSGSSSSSSSRGGSVLDRSDLITSWRKLFRVVVPWRQVSDVESIVWNAVGREQQWTDIVHRAGTPIFTWVMGTARYLAVYPKAVNVTREGLLQSERAFDTVTHKPFAVPRSTFGRQLAAAEDHEQLFNVIGRDFYVRLPCYSRAFPGKDLGGTEFRVQRHNHLFVDFDTVTTVESTRWSGLDAELTAAWQGFLQAALDHHCKTTRPREYQEKIQDQILAIAYYWFQLMPLSRGSAMVGLVSILGLSMAADMETTAHIPRDILVDWEGLLATSFEDFRAVVAPWLFACTQRAPFHLPTVRLTLPTTRHVIAALSDAAGVQLREALGVDAETTPDSS